MITTREVRRQLRAAGFRNYYWGWSAIYQLPRILEEGEKVERAVSGMYADGYAVMVATNRRILFLDKKPMSFRVEDIHYETITDVEHYLGPLAAKLRIHCLGNKSFELTSFQHRNIQAFAIHADQKANQLRLNMRNVGMWSQMIETDTRTAGQSGGLIPGALNPMTKEKKF